MNVPLLGYCCLSFLFLIVMYKHNPVGRHALSVFLEITPAIITLTVHSLHPGSENFAMLSLTIAYDANAIYHKAPKVTSL